MISFGEMLDHRLCGTESDILISNVFRPPFQCSGTNDIVSPHGIPLDLLDRLVIIQTLPYGLQDIQEIIKIRAQIEGLQLEDDALVALSQIGSDTTLRYAVQLLTPASQTSKVNGRTTVTKEDIIDVKGLFLDAKRSARFLTVKDNKYML